MGNDKEYNSYEDFIDDVLFEDDREQYEILQNLLENMETMDPDEWEKKEAQLTGLYAEELERATRRFADNAIGDPNWDL